MKSPLTSRPSWNAGFTLIELLVVIAVIIILVGMVAGASYRAIASSALKNKTQAILSIIDGGISRAEGEGRGFKPTDFYTTSGTYELVTNNSLLPTYLSSGTRTPEIRTGLPVTRLGLEYIFGASGDLAELGKLGAVHTYASALAAGDLSRNSGKLLPNAATDNKYLFDAWGTEILCWMNGTNRVLESAGPLTRSDDPCPYFGNRNPTAPIDDFKRSQDNILLGVYQ
jgi:prepilin-type N-terminal cleavage/methylation domain-containing protein